jgi:hypothetical protein
MPIVVISWTLAAAGLLAGQTGNYSPAPYSQTTAGPVVVAQAPTQAPASGPGRFLPWRRNAAPAPEAEPQYEEDRPLFQRIGDRFGKMFGRNEEPTIRQTTPNGTGRGTVIFDENRPGSTTAEPPLGAPIVSPKTTAPAQKMPAGPGGGSAPVGTPVPGPFKLSNHTSDNEGIVPTFKSATVPASSPAPVPTAKVPASPAELASRPNRISPGLADKVGRDEKFAWITGQLRNENGRWVLWYATPEVIDPYDGHLPIMTESDMSKFRDGDLVSVHGQVVTQGRTVSYRTQRVDPIPADRR